MLEIGLEGLFYILLVRLRNQRLSNMSSFCYLIPQLTSISVIWRAIGLLYTGRCIMGTCLPRTFCHCLGVSVLIWFEQTLAFATIGPRQGHQGCRRLHGFRFVQLYGSGHEASFW